MIKTMTAAEIRRIAFELLEGWNNIRKDIRLSPRQLYNLMGLKKSLEQEYLKINDTLVTIMEQHEGKPTEQGGYQVPPEHVQEVNALLQSFGEETVEIEFSPVRVRNEDNLPVEAMELLFEFIEIED